MDNLDFSKLTQATEIRRNKSRARFVAIENNNNLVSYERNILKDGSISNTVYKHPRILRRDLPHLSDAILANNLLLYKNIVYRMIIHSGNFELEKICEDTFDKITRLTDDLYFLFSQLRGYGILYSIKRNEIQRKVIRGEHMYIKYRNISRNENGLGNKFLIQFFENDNLYISDLQNHENDIEIHYRAKLTFQTTTLSDGFNKFTCDHLSNIVHNITEINYKGYKVLHVEMSINYVKSKNSEDLVSERFLITLLNKVDTNSTIKYKIISTTPVFGDLKYTKISDDIYYILDGNYGLYILSSAFKRIKYMVACPNFTRLNDIVENETSDWLLFTGFTDTVIMFDLVSGNIITLNDTIGYTIDKDVISFIKPMQKSPKLNIPNFYKSGQQLNLYPEVFKDIYKNHISNL